MTTFLPALLILLYCGWNARELLTSWQGRVEIGGSIAFLLWILPIVDTWLIRKKVIQPNISMLMMALVISLIGVLGSVNLVKYIGFAAALASFVPFTWMALPWWLSMLTWTSAFGWFSLHFFPHQAQVIRCVIALFASIWMIYFLRKKRDEA